LPFTVICRVCPNCEGAISSERLELGLPCEKCLPACDLRYEEYLREKEKIKFIYEKLLFKNKLLKFKKIYDLETEFKDFLKFFKTITGKTPWSAQRTWAKRLIRGESFAIIAPTGVGKTTFLMVYSLYHVAKGKGKLYFIVPTKVLLKQVYNGILDIVNSSSLNIKVLALGCQQYHREKEKEILSKGEFDILLSTAAQLSRNFDKIAKNRFTLIIVDDVDALLRNSKNVDRVLQLIGFNSDVINKAYRLVLDKIELVKLLMTNAQYDKIEEKKNKIAKLRKEIEDYIKGHKIGQIVVSSATGRSKGIKAKIFKELLNFEAGTVVEYMRNVVDTYVYMDDDYKKQILDFIKNLGPGGLIFVSQDLGINVAKDLVQYLNKENIKVALASSSRRGYVEKFIKGDVDILVGVASYYGVIVRGLDIPDKIRYAIFLGIPKFQVALDKSLNNPLKILSMLLVLEDIINDDKDRIAGYINRLRKIIEKISYKEYRLIINSLRENIALEGFLEKIRLFLVEVKNYILSKVCIEDIKRKVKENNLLILREINGKLYVVVPDVMTYIQASGRTSRMFANGMTKGLSIVIVDSEKVFKAFCKQLKYYIDTFEIRLLSQVDLEKVVAEIDKDREFVKSILEGKVKAVFKDPIISALMVVESPTKARTIASFFGKPSKRRLGRIMAYEVIIGDPILGTKDYMVTIVATRGHILDLVSDNEIGYHGVLVNNTITPVYSTIKRCRSCGYQFTLDENVCPKCESSRIMDSKEVIDILRRLAQEVDVAFIATDPDSEGEKIAWDIYVLLKPYVGKIHRIEFHEITRRAIVNALAKPRGINLRLVEAQIVRRIEDRWIGFELSRKLWLYFGKHWLSAGRVQTPVLGWIIKQHEKWRKTRRLFVEYVLENGLTVRIDYDVHVNRAMIKDYAKSSAFILIKSSFTEEINPPPPYNTNSLLFDLSTYYRMDTKYAMKILQQLFESGLITYHRTDSIRVSNQGIEVAKSYLKEVFNDEKLFSPRKWSPHGAHECIRPTRPLDVEHLRKMILTGSIKVYANLTYDHFKVYDLIFRRFIASQMIKAVVEKTRLHVKIGESVKVIEFVSKVIKEGFLKVLPTAVNESWRSISKGDVLKIVNYRLWKGSLERLYRQGDVIKLMKEKGIGRPSTYAKVLGTILKRGYVIESKNKYLVPTAIGKSVYSYLYNNFEPFVSEETTRLLEQNMEAIERGELNYIDVLRNLHEELQKLAMLVPTKAGKEAEVSW